MRRIYLYTTNGLRLIGDIHDETLSIMRLGPRIPDKFLHLESVTVGTRDERDDVRDINVYWGDVVAWRVIS